jgi:CarD family transcriptional regulator
MFGLNDKVVYPGHGVAIIEEIVEKKVGSSTVVFLKLVFLFKEMSILVPVYNTKNIGLRTPSSEKMVLEVKAELSRKPCKDFGNGEFTPSGWNKRNKDYQIKIQGGKLLDIAKIYRDLTYISIKKELSFGERTFLQAAEDLLLQELQTIKNEERDDVLQEVKMLCNNKVYSSSQASEEKGVSKQDQATSSL